MSDQFEQDLDVNEWLTELLPTLSSAPPVATHSGAVSPLAAAFGLAAPTNMNSSSSSSSPLQPGSPMTMSASPSLSPSSSSSSSSASSSSSSASSSSLTTAITNEVTPSARKRAKGSSGGRKKRGVVATAVLIVMVLPPALVWNTNEVLGLVPRPQRNQDLFAMLFEARVGSPFETLIVQRANVDLEDESSSSSKLITHVITLFRTRVSHINGTQTSAYFWFTQIYLAFVVELWDVLDNPVALKALADGTKHMICLFCRNKFFSLHSNPNGYVGEVASRQHNHKKIHGAARAVLQGGKFTLV